MAFYNEVNRFHSNKLYPEFEKFADENLAVGKFDRVQTISKFIERCPWLDNPVNHNGRPIKGMSIAFRILVLKWCINRGLWPFDTDKKVFTIIPQKLES